MITSSVYWIFTKLDHRIALWKGKNPIYFGVITIILFDNLYRQAYFVMHTFLVIAVFMPSQESERSCICVLWISILPISEKKGTIYVYGMYLA